MAKLLYLGQQSADDLSDNIAENLDRYREGDFLDIESAGDWRIPLSIEADLDKLAELKPGNEPKDEIANSLLVGDALRNLTPSLARENRMWVRLSHVECLDYSRKRWLASKSTDSALEKAIRIHMFAPTLTRCRDDHAISRLWWNYRIAQQVFPRDPSRALKIILSRADIRLNLVERPGIGARPALAEGVVRALETSDELLGSESLFREFMINVNLMGAGIAFEVLSRTAINEFMADCLEQAVCNVSEDAG